MQAPNPPTMPGAAAMRPHRGGLILAFGILGLVLCLIFGIVAWVMGNADLRDMDAGHMDPSGRGLTQAGKILGMVAVGLWLLGFVAWFLLMAMGIAIAGAGAAAGAAGAGGP